MIEQAIVVYLNTVSSITSLLGGRKVYYNRAPQKGTDGKDVKMPYAIVSNAGGSRKRDTPLTTEARDTLDIEVESADCVAGKILCDTILAALENYRGDMSPERDMHITCGSIRDLDGFQGSYRFIFAAYIRYRQTTVFPN